MVDLIASGKIKRVKEKEENIKSVAELKLAVYSAWNHDFNEALEMYKRLHHLEQNTANRPEGTLLSETELEHLAESIHHSIHNEAHVEIDEAILPDIAAVLVQKSNSLRYGNNGLAKAYADTLIKIGQEIADQRVIALGYMKLGDAKTAEALDFKAAAADLDYAGSLFLESGDLFGWGRTRIGRLFLSITLDEVDQILPQAEKADAIYLAINQVDYYLRMANCRMVLHLERGEYGQVIGVFKKLERELSDAEYADARTNPYLLNNVGTAYKMQGDFQQAKHFYTDALAIFERENQLGACDVVQSNIANLEMSLGRYNRALAGMLPIMERYGNQQSAHAIHLMLNIVECYLSLNQNESVLERASALIKAIGQMESPNPFRLGVALRYLGEAEARLGSYEDAIKNLTHAEKIFVSQSAESWQQDILLLRSEIEILRQNYRSAAAYAEKAYTYFSAQGQETNQARATLLLARTSLNRNDACLAKKYALQGLDIAKRRQLLLLQYQAYFVLGQIHEHVAADQRASRCYLAAVLTVQRLQKSLTITLQPYFLESTSGALLSLVRLSLLNNRAQEGFEYLERGKAQSIQTYLSNRERLFWSTQSPETQKLVARLDRLREDQFLYYRLSHDRAWLKEEDPQIEAESALKTLQQIESDMHALIEALYIQSSQENRFVQVAAPRCAEILATLQPGQLLLEFFTDGERIWLFYATNSRLEAVELTTSLPEIDGLSEKFGFNLRCATQMGEAAPVTAQLQRIAQQLSSRFYEALIRPIESHLDDICELIIVPYGPLHFLPFNTFFDGTRYLIERFEISLQPSAFFMQQPAPKREPGGLVLAHSANGRLPAVLGEGKQVSALTHSHLISGDEVTRNCLDRPPGQILHIAAHGQHRIDQPELSFIEFADGQLFTDDLLQHDLSYELVVLSACETGRSAVKKGEELIGLGRGILSAGAGALVASLWRVEDRYTALFMERFYTHLLAGRSKSDSLRQAQIEFIEEDRSLHLAFWAGFQLIGNREPLSI